MESVGRDEFGDPLYRINWGGVCIVREHPDKLHPKSRSRILGSRDGVRFVEKAEFRGETIPAHIELRHFAGGSARPKYLAYEDDEGQIIKVKRKEWVPKDKLAQWVYEYWDFGIPRFFIERKLTPQQCLDSGWYKIPGQIPEKGDYITVPNGKIEVNGRFFMPIFEYVHLIRKALWESINLTPTELKEVDEKKKDKKQKAYRDKLIEQDLAAEEAMIHVLENHNNKVHFHR